MVKKSFLHIALLILLIGNTSYTFAQDSNYPNRPIELVVPFSAGGTTDVIARIASQIVSAQWGVPILVVNKVGATGAIASEYVAKSKPDGYTLLVATASTHAILPAYRNNLPYDTVESFAPATLLASFPTVLAVNSKLQIKTVAELIELLKKNPDKFSFASSGTGGSTHFAGELFKLMTGTKMVHVPYKGSAPALLDVIAGNVEITFDFLTTVMPQVEQGKLRILGVASLQRTALAPSFPTVAETVPGFDVTSWVGVVTAYGTPKTIVDKISNSFGAAMKKAEIIKKLVELGADGVTNSPQDFSNFIRNDRAKWERISKDANIKE